MLSGLVMIEPEKLKAILYWTGVAVFLLIELHYSYRQPAVSKFRRWLANIPLSIVNGMIYHLVYFATLMALMQQAESRNLGLLHSLTMPNWLQIIIGVALLDFVIYVWHLLNHVVPLFWRFHRVHHSDLNMDVSTASRFHLGELLLSGLVRIMVIYAFGIPVTAYFLFEILTNLSIQFHHSSIQVNPRFDKMWRALFVPPSLHRVHHSVRIKERDSNYGVIFSVWDRLLGTLRTDVAQEGILIGIGSHRDFSKLGFWRLWLMPFTRKTL